MKEIFVYSRHLIEAIDPHTEPHLVISINCPGEEPARIRSNRAQLGRANLFFWDLEKVPTESIRVNAVGRQSADSQLLQITEAHLCQAEGAKKVIDLIEAHPEAKHILVHCLHRRHQQVVGGCRRPSQDFERQR